MLYRINEGDFEVPDDWRDESLSVFKGPDSEGYNLVISREKIPKSVDVKQHVSDRIILIEENLTKYRELARDVISVDGDECVWLEYSWKSPEGLMNQINILRVVRDTMVSFTFTTASTFTDGQRALFRQVLESYQEAKH